MAAKWWCEMPNQRCRRGNGNGSEVIKTVIESVSNVLQGKGCW